MNLPWNAGNVSAFRGDLDADTLRNGVPKNVVHGLPETIEHANRWLEERQKGEYISLAHANIIPRWSNFYVIGFYKYVDR